jgi:hypothetical protein
MLIFFYVVVIFYMKKLRVADIGYLFYVDRMVSVYDAECRGISDTEVRLGYFCHVSLV